MKPFTLFLIFPVLPFVGAEFFERQGMKVLSQNVIGKVQASLTHCHLKCTLNHECIGYGTLEDTLMGQITNCYLLRSDGVKLSSKAESRNTISMYIVEMDGTIGINMKRKNADTKSTLQASVTPQYSTAIPYNSELEVRITTSHNSGNKEPTGTTTTIGTNKGPTIATTATGANKGVAISTLGANKASTISTLKISANEGPSVITTSPGANKGSPTTTTTIKSNKGPTATTTTLSANKVETTTTATIDANKEPTIATATIGAIKIPTIATALGAMDSATVVMPTTSLTTATTSKTLITSTTSSVEHCLLNDTKFIGDLVGVARKMSTWEECLERCENESNCYVWSFFTSDHPNQDIRGNCRMRNAVYQKQVKTAIVSGEKSCRRICWTRVGRGCVNKHDIVEYTNKTVEECKGQCFTNQQCQAVEYGVNHGGKGLVYQPGSCKLQSSSDSSNCDGGHYNVDLYVLDRDCTHI